MSRKTVAKSLADGVVQLAIPGVYIMMISYDSATVNIFVFIEQRSISFQNDISLKNHEIGSLVVRKVKKSWDSRQNRELRQASRNCWIFSSCLSPGRVKKLQKFINFCLRVGHSANMKYSKSTWRQSSCDPWEMYKIRTSRNGNDKRRGADWFTKGVYIWVTHLHIAVPTITCSLRYA